MKSHFSKWLRLSLLLGVGGASVALTSCSNEIEGPAPTVSESPAGGDSPTTPSFVCNEQLETWVTLRGDGFSPLVIDSLDDDVPTTAENPTIALTLASDVDGEASAASFSTTLENASDIDVRWIDSETMQFLARPSLELPPGIYDVTVTNSNGETTTQAGVFGVLPRPTVTALVPAFTCLAQGGKALEVVGTDFLIQGDEVPTVEVGEKTYEPTTTGGCRELDGPFGAYQLCESLSIELAENDFEPSVQDVSVLNIDPAACRSLPEEDGSSLRVVPPPTLERVTEELACVSEGERSFVVTGTDIISHEGGAPTVAIGAETYEATASDCETVEVFGGAFGNCTAATFTIPQDALAPDVYPVVLSNPSPADCSSSEPVDLTIVGPPSIDDVQPDVVCSEQIDNSFTITGEGFIVYDGDAPTVTIGGESFTSTASDCAAIDSVVNATAETCTQLDVQVPAGTLAAGETDVVVTNPMPAGCSSVDSVTVAFVPPPEVTAVVEDFTCVETRTDTVRLEGTGFLDIDGALPSATFGGVDVTTLSVDECMPVPGAMAAQTCSVLVVEVAQGSLSTGNNAVVVTNPEPAQCVSEEMVDLEVFPAPLVGSVEPALFCTDGGDTTLDITGQNFFIVDGAQPTVEIAGVQFAATVDATTCSPTSRATVESCTALTATVPAGSLDSGDSAVSVVNPEPVACPSSADGQVLVGGPPNITGTTPMAVCGGDSFDGMVTLDGDTFLRIDGSQPTLTVEGQAVAVDGLSGCSAVPHPTLQVETCTQLSLTIPVALRDTDSEIVVTNPAPADCGASSTTLTLAPTPTIASVTPLRVCDAGGTIQIDGTDFEPGLEVTLGGIAATNVTVNAAGTSATADFGMTMEGTYDLTVRNPASGCANTHDEQVRIVTGPRAFYADPPVLYDGISTQITIYLTGLFGGTVQSIELVDSMGTVTALTDIVFDANRPNTAQAVVPAGILDANVALDAFDIVLTDDVMCSEQTDDLLSVTNELTVSVADINPPFGWTNDSTGVTVTSEEPTPANLSPFAATPRVYLNPDMPQMGDIATELRATEFVSEFELNGIVPSGLPVGTYDVIVINPDGGVGLLDAAFDVTADPPPEVDTVSPGSWETNDPAWAFVVEGADFRMPTVEATCFAPDGTQSNPAVTVVGSTDSTIDATVDTSALAHLSVCELRITNTNDGTYVDFAPVTVTNPAGNFVSFANGPDMSTARRAPAVVSGAPSSSASYLYAVGGDSGTSASALASVEASPLNRFGEPGAWFDLPTALPAGRTLAQAVRVRDFVYLVGGHDGTAPTSDVSRALVLNPLDTSVISNVEFDIDLTMTGGLPTGVYYYRVAPVVSGTDVANPGGEMLASERQPVRVPFAGVDVTLDWTPYPNATEYRVYRSPMPDVTAGSEELLAVVPAGQTSFLDGGTATTDPAETPLPLGSLGEWHSVGQLTAARHSHGVAVAVDPADADLYHLYAVGGTDGTSALTTLEKVSVTAAGPRDQNVDDTNTSVTGTLATARTELSAVVGNAQTASNLSSTYLYVLGGRSGGGIGGLFSRTTDFGEVLAGGDISGFGTTTELQRQRAGYAAAVANNNIVVACGQGGMPSNTADKMPVNSDGTLGLSSALGDTGMLRNRYLPGFTSFAGLFYLAGGEDDMSAASNTIDYSILGGTP